MDLNISCLHLKVTHGEPDRNRERLLGSIKGEAEQGAQIILTPEMAVSGYSFSSRNEIAAMAVNETDDFSVALQQLAAGYGCYICIGMAMQERESAILYNSSLVIGPQGIILRYDKVNAEIRWACPGAGDQGNVFQTQWGRVGVLICSDTYHELMPRATALKGADLLLVPANWPPTGLDPVEVWQARALENGMHIVVCNRTGPDINMDCSLADSCLINGNGEVKQRHRNPDSSVFRVSVPLVEGKLDSAQRLNRLAGRRPDQYHDIYRSLAAVQDLTSFYELPQTGKLTINCFVPEEGEDCCTQLQRQMDEIEMHSPSLWILPEVPMGSDQAGICLSAARKRGSWLLFKNTAEELEWTLFTPDGTTSTWPVLAGPDAPPVLTEIGPACVALICYGAFRHPEMVLSLSKQGCDLVVLSEAGLRREMKLLAGARTINQVAVAVCCLNGGGIWMRPEVHQRWQEHTVEPTGICSFGLDTSLTRNKRFQDRVDFATLLKMNSEGGEYAV